MSLIDKIRYCLKKKKGLTAGEIVELKKLAEYWKSESNFDDLPRRDTDAAEAIYNRLKEKP